MQALERIAGLLEDREAGLTLSERGDATAMRRSPNFRLLAAMNPATDAGKRALPTLLRSRFTELWVSEPSAREDLEALVASYLKDSGCQQPVSSVVNFYLAAKADAVRLYTMVKVSWLLCPGTALMMYLRSNIKAGHPCTRNDFSCRDNRKRRDGEWGVAFTSTGHCHCCAVFWCVVIKPCQKMLSWASREQGQCREVLPAICVSV